ncbi:hypothetical protein [Sphaerochaeta halotolerans]|uniref:hypothetical protein n=1 Tax=Sphaerochaeta halotolerans TaxID=2293840 RepID=UPI0013705CC9|nr:hypothetical protein [Sphaerochaeta halotolerans]MXI87114.1 hypothetical protein [Sphaerochaeta halotolerans]
METYTHTSLEESHGTTTQSTTSHFWQLSLEMKPANSFYGYSELSVGNTNTLKNGFRTTMLGTNIPVVAPSILIDHLTGLLLQQIIGVFQLGRDRLSSLGNLIVSDSFKYTFVTSFFRILANIYDPGAAKERVPPMKEMVSQMF